MSKFDFQKHFPKLSKVSEEPSHTNRIVMNDQSYLLSIWLDNHTDCMELPILSIKSLEITDDLLGFNQMGNITYSTPNYSIERFATKLGSSIGEDCEFESELLSEENRSEQFVFKGTGSELIHIKFQLIPEGDNTVSNSSDLIMQTFVITDVDDTGNNLAEKVYKLKFEGIEKNVLKNYRIDNYVCGDASRDIGRDAVGKLDKYPRDGVWENRNNFKADKTGEAIFNIMELSYMNWSTKTGLTHNLTDMLPSVRKDSIQQEGFISGIDELLLGTVNFNSSQYVVDLPNTNDRYIRFTDQQGGVSKIEKDSNFFWDFGAEDSFLYTQFTSNTSSWTIIQKFLNFHTSSGETSAKFNDVPNISKFDPCILKLERPIDENTLPKVSLRPLVSFFKSVKTQKGKQELLGEGFMGLFTFESASTIGNILETTPKLLDSMFCNPNKTETDKPITEFSFDPTKPSDANTFFKTYASQRTGGKTVTNINGTDGEFNNLKEYIGQNYVKFIYEYQSPINNNNITFGDLVNVTNNGLKSEENIILSHFQDPPTESASVASARNRGIFTFLFMNDALSFITEGQIARKSGLFFYATTDRQNKEDKILNRMNGNYMCSSITHLISPNEKTFKQYITGSKFYARPTKDELVINTNDTVIPTLPSLNGLDDRINGVFV